ncbi:MAG: GNAT family N-acetyltransferase [Bacteroidota bacterium]
MNPVIREVKKEDIGHLRDVLNSIDLFPAEMLEDMISGFFNNTETEDIWFTATENGLPISIGYCAPEKLAEGTFNLYAIGVRGDVQGKGIGKKMMQYLEEQLKQKGHRVLIVETSGTDDFELTRKFYENLDYNKEAVIRDFWDEGDDKVVYWKKLIGF